MTLSLAFVKYIGPAMQTRLESNGITTVEQLAVMTEQELADLPGIGMSTAAGIIESAKALIAKAEANLEPVISPETIASPTEDNSEAVATTATTVELVTETQEPVATELKPVVKPKAPAAKRPSRSRAKQPVVTVAVTQSADTSEPEVNSVEPATKEVSVDFTTEPAKKESSSKKTKKSTKAKKESTKGEAKVKREAEKQLKKAKKVLEKERKKEAKALKKIADKEKKEKKLADKAAKKIVKKAKKAAKSAGAKVS